MFREREADLVLKQLSQHGVELVIFDHADL